MAGFKTMFYKKVETNILKEVEKYQKINKNMGRSSQTEIKKREEYLASLAALFDIACKDLEQILGKDRLLAADDDDSRYRAKEGYSRKTEDIRFLEDQRGARRMTMGSRDSSYEVRLEQNLKKKVSVVGTTTGETSQIEKQMDVNDGNEDSDVEEKEELEEDFNSNYTTGARHKKKSSTVLIELPRDILNSPDVVGMLDRTGTTSRNAVGVVSSILKTGKIGGKSADLSQFSLSRSSLERKRVSNRSIAMEEAMKEFSRNKPDLAALHWDGKLVKDCTGTLRENEAILVSGAPHYLEGKILAVSLLEDEEGKPTSTGDAQAQAVLAELEKWDVKENVVALVFDTTSSNTGVRQGATVRLQNALGRPVFFLGCRHHISELIVKACWYSIFEADLSPDCKFFAHIKEVWSTLDTSSGATITTLSPDAQSKREVMDFYRELLLRRNKKEEVMIRDDYRELAELAVILVGETPPSGRITWKKQGACNKARFCAFGIYSMKALAFSEQLELDIETIEGLRQVCSFLVLIYILHFLSSSIGCDSAVNDISLFKKLFAYKSVDSRLADEALVVLRRHCWYLIPEVIPFSLFSDKLTCDDKARLAARILSLKSNIPQSYKLGKPKFPNIAETTELVDLVTSESIKFFNILGLDFHWLEMNPDKWEEDLNFKKAREFARTVKVTNDVAERGVKLATDFATLLTKDDTVRSMLLQGVEKSRKIYPNFKKQTLNS